jgi:hypothetical protein
MKLQIHSKKIIIIIIIIPGRSTAQYKTWTRNKRRTKFNSTSFCDIRCGRDRSVDLVTTLRSGYHRNHASKDLPSHRIIQTASRGSTKHSTEWIYGAPFLGPKRPEYEDDHSNPLINGVRLRETVTPNLPPPTRMPSCAHRDHFTTLTMPASGLS